MPQRIVQNNSGAHAVQIGYVHGDVTIIQVAKPAQTPINTQREMGMALGGFSLMFIGVSLATPFPSLKMASLGIGSLLAVFSWMAHWHPALKGGAY